MQSFAFQPLRRGRAAAAYDVGEREPVTPAPDLHPPATPIPLPSGILGIVGEALHVATTDRCAAPTGPREQPAHPCIEWSILALHLLPTVARVPKPEDGAADHQVGPPVADRIKIVFL